jgi:hypothetical protein
MNWTSEASASRNDGLVFVCGDAPDENGLASLVAGSDLKTAADVAEAIRSREGLLDRLLGDAPPSS